MRCVGCSAPWTVAHDAHVLFLHSRQKWGPMLVALHSLHSKTPTASPHLTHGNVNGSGDGGGSGEDMACAFVSSFTVPLSTLVTKSE